MFEGGKIKCLFSVKTQRRLNALEHVILPRYEATVAFVQNALEEGDREEFFRRKQVKLRRGR